MKLSDYIAQFLYEQGLRHVFGVSGGAIIHTFDAVARHEGMEVVNMGTAPFFGKYVEK